MMKSKWGQSYPFNAKTGYDYSGCVATAYYHQWPAQGQEKRICGNLLPDQEKCGFQSVALRLSQHVARLPLSGSGYSCRD